VNADSFPFGTSTSSAFGDVAGDGRELGRSFALHDAADNLISKALDALSNGDEQRALRLVGRALKVPYDEHNGYVPGVWTAYMMLHGVISADLADSEPGDHAWLDTAEAVPAEPRGRLPLQCEQFSPPSSSTRT
jgi:hypothetical protein